jgi:hypothetical protein
LEYIGCVFGSRREDMRAIHSASKASEVLVLNIFGNNWMDKQNKLLLIDNYI